MKKAILKTLHYADIFDYPLTFEELRRFLIKRHANVNELQANLSELLGEALVGVQGGYYFIPGREDLVGKRMERKKWADIKLKRAKKIAKFLKIIPWVKIVAVTGALAVENCKEEDDIDLMIITSINRLWLSRGLVVLFLRLFGLYRRPKKIKNTICPNVWLSLGSLKFFDEDLFTAHEIAQVKPLWEKQNCYLRFIEDNLWIKGFLPNWEPRLESKMGKKEPFRGSVKLGRPLLNVLDLIAYKLQFRYMQRKITRERVGRNIALFHPIDTKNRILSEFEKKMFFKSRL